MGKVNRNQMEFEKIKTTTRKPKYLLKYLQKA